jgi:predicted DNA binding protein
VESVVERLAARPDVESVTVLRDTGEKGSVRVLVQPPSIGSLLADVGGVVDTIRVADGAVTVVAEFSPRTDISRAIDRMREVYPETTVGSLLTKEPAETRPDPTPLSSLTAKQREALEAAYHSGFFERPQRQTADEIAATLDVSRSTFLKHLRLAENALLGELVTDSEWDGAEEAMSRR